MPDPDATQPTPKPMWPISPGPTPTGYQRTGGGGFKWQPPSPEKLAQLLPQYHIEALIGRGGMGAVYKGTQKALERPVAIKILPPEVDDEDASYTERFKNEAKIMARLEHPAIVPVYDFGETSEGQLYFVMGFINGTDIHQMIQSQGKLPPEHALAITAHVCDALGYAHQHGVIHRDIKPSNILINMEGQVKVADFGLAKAHDTSQSSGLTKTGLAMGTPDYVAPETLSIGMVPDGRADLYAVGVMLYQMLTGQVPRGAFDLPSKLTGCDPRFDSIVIKAMKYDREDRYPTATDLRRDLDIILTAPMVQSGGQSSAAIPKQSLPQKPTGKPPQPRSDAGTPARKESPPAGKSARTTPEPPAKSKTPLFIGLGAAAAIGIGAFAMFGGEGRRVRQNAESAPTSTTPDRTLASAPTASAPKPAPAAPKPVPAAPSTPVSSVPPFPASSSEQFPPGKWVKVFTKFEDLPGELRNRDSGWKWNDGWLQQTNPNKNKTFSVPGFSARNAAIRARIRYSAELDGFLFLSGMPGGTTGRLGHHRFRIGASGLHLEKWAGKNYTRVHQQDLPTGLQDGVMGEFAFLNGRVFARGHDILLPQARDDDLQEGRIGYYGSAEIRDIEVINLDGLPEAEALKILGVDEKGNDLRQKPAAMPAASRSTPGTATKDAPFTNTLGMKFVPVPGTNILMGIHETRRRDYDAYAKAVPGVDPTWKAPVYDGTALVQTDDHPVVMVGWEDAKAFADWLSRQEGNRYRLPTEHEWNLAVVTGLTNPESTSPAEVARLLSTQYPWGTAKLEDGDKLGNYKGSQDGFAGTAPVMSFPANPLGIHDLGGNVWEWCLDLFEKGKDWNVIRGGGFMNYGPPRKSNWRVGGAPNFRAPPANDYDRRVVGFRLVVEKGDGQTRPPSATTSPASPSLPVSKSPDPQFPPGQWVKLFTKYEELPEELRKADSGVKFEDGWLSIPRRLNLPPLHEGQQTNLAVRVTLKGAQVDAAKFLAHLSLRYDDVSAHSQYMFRQYASMLQVACIGLPSDKLATKPRDEILLSHAYAAPVNRSWRLEFGLVASQLIARVDDQLVPMVTDMRVMSGRTSGFIATPNVVRDIEVINLDGLPEAEALRILGVDEKGNDLRALAAKQEQQKAEMAKAADAMAAIPELKALHEQFTKLTAERVTAPFEADVAKLNSGYLGGIDRKIAEERGKGNLDGVLALEEEKKLVVASSGTRSQGPDGLRLPTEATTGAVPASDAETTPSTLKDLRQIYRDAHAKLDAARAANLKLLTDPLAIRLKQLESTLTQANRIDHAKTVREYREGLGKEGSAGTPARTSPTGGAAAKMNEAGKSARAPLKKFPSGDDRKAAEWVLSVGGTIRIQGSDKMILDATDLPRGRFEVTGVYLEFTSTNRPKGPIENLLPLAGLKGLTRLNVKSVPMTDAHWEILPSLPSLQAFMAERTGVTDGVFAHLAATKLKNLELIYETSITGEGIEGLSAAKSLEKLTMNNCLPSEEGLRQLGKLDTLSVLALSGAGSKLRDEHLPLLAGLRKLDSLLVRRSALTAEALAAMKQWSTLTTLGFDLKPGTTAAQVALLAKAFPKLENLFLEGEASWSYAAEDVSALAGFPKLKAISMTNSAISDEALAGVLALPKLESLRFSSCTKVTDAALENLGRHKSLTALSLEAMPNITDAGLPHLVGLKSLSRLELLRCPNLTSDAIAAFQKARPEVTVTR